jgi:hypothetical protein
VEGSPLVEPGVRGVGASVRAATGELHGRDRWTELRVLKQWQLDNKTSPGAAAKPNAFSVARLRSQKWH